MLTRLHVQGYKALRDIDTTLEPLTVIVGPNGCGKTSVLEAIALVRECLAEELESRRNLSVEDLLSKGAEPESGPRVELTVHLDAAQQEYLRRSASMEAQDLTLDIILGDHGRFSLHFDPPLSEGYRDPDIYIRPIGERVGDFLLSSASLLELDVNAIARPSYSRDIVPYVATTGAGLATVLSWLQGERHERFETIQSQLREFVPEVERVRTRRTPVSFVDFESVPTGQDEDGNEIRVKRSIRREEIGHEILLDFRHAKGVPAKHASEGTLLLLGLLTVVHTQEVSALLLDDIDRALHPKAQQQLITYLRKLTSSGIQVIATTHSPYLVLHLEYEEVRAMMVSDSGGALIGKLTDHPEYERWREDMTPSEFWTVFGEEWLAKVKSKAEGDG